MLKRLDACEFSSATLMSTLEGMQDHFGGSIQRFLWGKACGKFFLNTSGQGLGFGPIGFRA